MKNLLLAIVSGYTVCVCTCTCTCVCLYIYMCVFVCYHPNIYLLYLFGRFSACLTSLKFMSNTGVIRTTELLLINRAVSNFFNVECLLGHTIYKGMVI